MIRSLRREPTPGPSTGGRKPLRLTGVSLEVEAGDVTIVEHEDESASKYTTRGTAAHGIGLPEEARGSRPILFIREWIVTRKIEGRIYRRSDELVMVELED